MLMKNKLTLLLIEDDPIACQELQDYFDACEDIADGIDDVLLKNS